MYLIDIDPERRRRGRIYLWGGIGALLLLLVGAIWLFSRPNPYGLDQSWLETDFEDDPAVRLLQEYVRIDTSNTTGSELEGARFLARELEAMGIDATIEDLGEGRANLWAVVEGRDPRALVLHHHIDVTAIREPEEWTYEPFGGTIDLPWIFGRGAFDMKSVAIAQLEAIRRLIEDGAVPARSVIFLATGSEEVGSDLGTRWVLARHPELAQRAWAVLTEGGVVEVVKRDEIKYWGIEFAQRRFVDLWACAGEREPLEALRASIPEWAAANERWRLPPEAVTFFDAYASSRFNPIYRELLAEPWKPLLDATRMAELPPYLKSMFTDEVEPFYVEPDPEGGYRMRLVLHLLPDSDPEAVRRRLLPDWMTAHVSLVAMPAPPRSPASDADHPVLTTLEDLVAERYPGSNVGPYFQPWSATDARFFRAAGVASFGFSPFVIFSSSTLQVDRVDERFELPGFVEGVELYAEALARLAG